MPRLLASKAVASITNNDGSASIGTSWTQVSASVPAACSAIEVFDSSGQPLELGMGTVGNEVSLNYVIPPGGSTILLPIALPSGARLVARSKGVATTSGTLVLNLFA